MARKKRNETELLIDRVAIADMLIRNMSLRQIAQELNKRNEGRYELTFTQVYYDVKKMQAEWYQESQDLIEQGIVREIKKLDKIEAECWEAWEQSKKGSRSTVIAGGFIGDDGKEIAGNVVNRKLDSNTGDVRYLMMIERCIVRRSELLGVMFPQKKEDGSNLNIDNAIVLMEKNQLLDEINKLCSKPRFNNYESNEAKHTGTKQLGA